MADSKLLVVPIVLFVLLFCNRSDAVISDVIDTEALGLKPNQEIEKLKSKIETLGELKFLALFIFKYDLLISTFSCFISLIRILATF